MTVITSKSQFLKCISKCEKHVKWLIKDNKKLNIFVNGINEIKQILGEMPNKLPFCKFESLEFEGDFSDFVCNSNDDLLKIRLESVAINLSDLCGIYKKYLPLIKQETDYCKAKKKRLPKESISDSATIEYIKSHSLVDVEQRFKSILEFLRVNAVCSQKNVIPTGVEQANMRFRLEERIGAIVLRLPEGNSALCGCLNSAKNELQGMIFPKNDKSVLQCYLLLMEALDNIDTADEIVMVKHITSLINQWKSLSR